MATMFCNICGGRLLRPGAHALFIFDLNARRTSVDIYENEKFYICGDCLDELKEFIQDRKIIYEDV